MPSRLCLFTFNPHPSDTQQMVKIMYNLLHPFTNKMSQYILVKEKVGTPQEHIHFLFFKDNVADVSKIKQVIENVAIKNFIKNNLPMSNSDYKHSFDYRLIKNSSEEHMYKIGYVLKETGVKPLMKGFTNEYILQSVQYYYATEQANAKTINNSWKHLKPNELHCYMEHYSEKLGISIADPNLVPLMKEDKVSFNQITMRQMSITKDELVLAHKDQVDQFTYNSAVKSSQSEEEDNFYWKLQFMGFLESLKELDEYDDDQVVGKLKLMYYEAKNKIGGI